MPRRNLKDTKRLLLQDYLSSEDKPWVYFADKYGVSASTVRGWAKKDNWNALKASKMVSKQNSVHAAYRALEGLMNKLLEQQANGEDTAKTTNEISQINKTIQTLTGAIPLDTTITILDDFLDHIPHSLKTKEFRSDRELIANYQQSFLVEKARKMNLS